MAGDFDFVGEDDMGYGEDPRFRQAQMGQAALPLTVKNTFIDVEHDQDIFEPNLEAFSRRHVSEPAPHMFDTRGPLGPGMGMPPPAMMMSGPGPQGGYPDFAMDFLNAYGQEMQGGGGPPRGKGKGKKGGGDPKGGLGLNPMGGGKGDFNPMADFGAMAPGMPPAMPPDMVIPQLWANKTTVMMRNLPNKYTQRMLLTEVNQTGFLGTFDFLYLPIDPETAANRGYAFLNFIDPGFAWMFKTSYEGRKMNRFKSTKVVSVMPATLQGFDANYAHYSAARVNRGDPAARPLFLREPSQMVQNIRQDGRDDRNARNRNRGGKNGSADQLPPPGKGGGGQPRPPRAMRPEGPPMTSGKGMPPMPYPDAGGELPVPGPPSGPTPDMDGARPMVPKFCPQCGGPIQAYFQFCPHCGASINLTSLAPEDGNAIEGRQL